MDCVHYQGGVPFFKCLGTWDTPLLPVSNFRGTVYLAGEGVSAKGGRGCVSDGGDRQGGDF